MINNKIENNLLLPPNLPLWTLSLLFHPNGLESSISLIYKKEKWARFTELRTTHVHII